MIFFMSNWLRLMLYIWLSVCTVVVLVAFSA